MRFKFDPVSLTCSLFLLVTLILLATLGKNLGWIRSFFGDVLAVAWVYYSISTVIKTKPAWIAACAFSTGALLELAQYLLSSNGVQIANPGLRIVFGSTPDLWDIAAYALGATLVLFLQQTPGLSGRLPR